MNLNEVVKLYYIFRHIYTHIHELAIAVSVSMYEQGSC